MDRIWIIVIGGLIPAFAFGISAVLQKGAVLAGVGAGSYMIYDGLMLLACGFALRTVLGESGWGGGGIPLALGAGLLFAIAVGAICLALQRFAAPISLIAPITVISTLVTVLLGFVVFREHEGVSGLRLLAGAALVVAGAALAATS